MDTERKGEQHASWHFGFRINGWEALPDIPSHSRWWSPNWRTSKFYFVKSC